MGWSVGWNSRKELIEHLTRNTDNGTVKRECLKKVTKGNILWTVWEITRTGEEKPTRYIGYDIMARYSGKEWGYKDGCESVGPIHFTCPLSFFKDVPEPDGEYAREWRAKVVEIASRHQGLKIGDWVQLPNCKPRFVKLSQVHPRFRGSGFLVRRKLIGGKAPELTALEAQLNLDFPNRAWQYPWRQGMSEEAHAEMRNRLIEYAKEHPVGLDPAALRCLGICQELASVWIGNEEDSQAA
jgi:hypothetical protein